MKMRKNGMTLTTALFATIIVGCILVSVFILALIGQRSEKTPATNRYEAHYFPNRTVIRITGPAREMEKALSDIKEKYNVEEVLPRGIAPIEDLTIIALPKDPNSPSL